MQLLAHFSWFVLLESDLEGTACAKISAVGIDSIKHEVGESALTNESVLVPKNRVPRS